MALRNWSRFSAVSVSVLLDARPVTGPDRRSRLRSATDHAHRRLDEIVDQAGFFQDRPSYASYLLATLRARLPLELALTDSRAAVLFEAWPERRLAAALDADIVDVTGIAAVLGPIVKMPELSAAQVVGSLYVLEGSALGALQLAPRAHMIGMSPLFGARHFARQTGIPKCWSAFLRVLEALPLDAAEEDECIAAAIAVFAGFEAAYRAVIRPPLRALRSPPSTSPQPPPALSRPSLVS